MRIRLKWDLSTHSRKPFANTQRIYKFPALPHREFENRRGLGVQARINDKNVQVGSLKYLNQLDIDTDITDFIELCRSQAWTPIFVVIDQKLEGILGISDALKIDSKQAVA